MRTRFCLAIALALTACPKANVPVEAPASDAVRPGVPPRPDTPRGPVTDTYHDVAVTEEYRWLEEDGDESVQAWQKAQDAHARAQLEALPVVEPLKEEYRRLFAHEAPSFWGFQPAGGRLFAQRFTPPDAHAVLVVLDGLEDPESARVLLDPNTLDPEGLTSINLVEPSPDGTKVAVSLTRGGTESGDVSIVDVATGEVLGEVIPRVMGGTAGGSIAWLPDSSGLLYTRYPREGERPAEDMDFYVQVYQHLLDGSDDTYVIGEQFTRIAEIELRVHQATSQLLVTVQDGDGGEFAHWVGPLGGELTQFSDYGDRTLAAFFSEDGESLYALSVADHPRGRLLRTSARKPDVASATEVVPETEDTLVASFWGSPSVLELSGRLYLRVQRGGPSALVAYTLDGKPAEAPAVGEVASVSGMVADGAGGFLFRRGSYTEPSALWRFDATSGEASPTAFTESSEADLSGVEVVRLFATSKDGTKVPVNVLKPEGMALDGQTPCVVTAYGGYGVSLSPGFAESAAPLLERGVCYAVANLRGGGEYGEEWHLQGNLTRKQNVFDDFHAVLTHLVEEDYTSADRLGIRGGSNGGLLMGALLTQHPESVAVVMSAVGIYDMLRVELSPNGAFNIPEFGTVTDPEQFAALYAYSPYHQVRDDATYPPLLLTTGANDPRVAPMQSRKMAARMQQAGAETWLRVEMDAGHGAGNLDQRIDLVAHQMGFLLHHLGIEE